MNIYPASEKKIREFLLGRLPQKQSEEIEEQLLADDELEDLVGLVEDEIIDQYVDGPISGRDKKAIEDHFLLPPARQSKLAFAQLLRKRLRTGSAPPAPGFLSLPGTSAAWLLAGLISMISVGSGVYVVVVRKDTQTQPNKPQVQQEVAHNALPPLLVKFVAGDFKSGGPPEIVEIPITTGLIEAHIPLFDGPSPAKSYTVKIQNEERRQIAAEADLKPHIKGDGSELIVNIDRKLMSPGTWTALVTPNRKDGVTEKFYCTVR